MFNSTDLEIVDNNGLMPSGQPQYAGFSRFCQHSVAELWYNIATNKESLCQ